MTRVQPHPLKNTNESALTNVDDGRRGNSLLGGAKDDEGCNSSVVRQNPETVRAKASSATVQMTGSIIRLPNGTRDEC
jgi:hypothetical protein